MDAENLLWNNLMITLINHSVPVGRVLCTALFTLLFAVLQPIVAKFSISAKFCGEIDRQFLDEKCPCQLFGNTLSILLSESSPNAPSACKIFSSVVYCASAGPFQTRRELTYSSTM